MMQNVEPTITNYVEIRDVRPLEPDDKREGEAPFLLQWVHLSWERVIVLAPRWLFSSVSSWTFYDLILEEGEEVAEMGSYNIAFSPP